QDEPIENTAGTEEPNADNFAKVQEDAAAVEDFVAFVNNTSEEMDMTHEYSHDALVKLTDAVEAMANEVNYNLETDLSQVKQIAKQITTDAYSEKHANKLAKAFRILTNSLMGMQQAHYPDLADEVNA